MRAKEFTNFTYKTEPYEGWNGNGVVVRAYDGGTEVGHVIFEPTEDDNTQWYAVDVEVEELYQRKGIATKMYDIAKKAAKQQSAIIVKSHTQTDAGRGLWQDKQVWEQINESKTTLNNMYGGNFPDRDEEFWDYVTTGEFDQPLTVETMQKHKVLIMLLSQYRAEHIDDITDMLDDDQQEIVQSYTNDPALASKVIVVADGRIIDGNHRALAAAIKGVPIKYVDLAELEQDDEEETLNEYETQTDNSRQIFDRLTQLGYTMLGSGQDATVWAKDEGSVIKILMPSRAVPGPAQDADRGFLTFYNFCKEHPELPNLPKFIDISGEHHTVFELNGVPYRQIAMERLQPIQNNSFEEAMVWLLSDLAKGRAPWNNVVNMMKKPETWELDPSMANMPQSVTEKLADPLTNKQYGILYLTMSRLYHLGLKSGLSWDLHTENVMQRKDGTLVIVDPYFT